MNQKGALAAALTLGLAAVATASEWTVDRWQQTVHYRYTFAAAGGASGILRVTAVDDYEVYLNGIAIGVGQEWTTPEVYDVAIQGGTNHLALRVRNSGAGVGSGVLVELVAGAQRWVSTTSALNETWLWTATFQSGTAWLTADLTRNTDWRPVQRGSLDRAAIALGADTLGAEVIAGFPGNVEVGAPGGGLQLRNLRGENVALGMPSNRPEVFDNRPTTVWTINPANINTTANVDLLRRQLVVGVRVLTAGRTAAEFAENTMRGYAVQVSNDGFQWSEVGVIHGIETFERSEVTFRPIATRHVRLVVAEVDPLRRSRVAEIQVLGEGRVLEGSYLSEPFDLGTPTRKNFGAALWEADLPPGTSATVQFRSADDTRVWSPWSPPLDPGRQLTVPEPRALLQYRVNLATAYEDTTPRFRALRIEHSADSPASRARAYVMPNDAVLGVPTTYVYTLDLEVAAGDLGVELVRIATPSRAQVAAVELPAGLELATATVLPDSLELRFAAPLRSSGTLRVTLLARLLTNQFAFAAHLVAPGGAATLNAEEDTAVDGASGAARSWFVRATDVTGDLLSELRANPPVVTPNGDGINDNTVFEFTLARVSALQEVDLDILGLDGHLVRRLAPPPMVGGEYARPPAGRDPARSPGYWDGRDDAGDLVPPGLYVVRLRARLGRGDQTRLRTVAVVY